MFYSYYGNLCFIPRNRRSTLALTHHAAHNNKCCAAQSVERPTIGLRLTVFRLLAYRAIG